MLCTCLPTFRARTHYGRRSFNQIDLFHPFDTTDLPDPFDLADLSDPIDTGLTQLICPNIPRTA